VKIILAWGTTPRDAARIAAGGVLVREVRNPYIHAKVILIDGREAFVGSENLSAESLDRNREVGILIHGASLHRLIAVFARDWTLAVPLAARAA
jgi:phosphatidylserine/phosphatidylglycerophosphate/cardiolipin synthase-like enzyme